MTRTLLSGRRFLFVFTLLTGVAFPVALTQVTAQPPGSGDEHLAEQSPLISEQEHLIRLRQYSSDIALVQLLWKGGRLDRAVQLLERHKPGSPSDDIRGIEWELAWQLLHAEQATLRDHQNPVYCVRFVPNSSTVISGDLSYTYATPGELREWNPSLAETTEMAAKSAAPETPPQASKRLWLQSVTETPTYSYFHGIRSISVSADGNRVAFTDGPLIRILDRPTSQIVTTLVGHTANVESLAWTPDGAQLVSGSGDQTLRFWDIASGKSSRTIALTDSPAESLAVSPNGKWLAAGCGHSDAPESVRQTTGEILIWNLDNLDDAPRRISTLSAVRAITWSPDGSSVVAGTHSGQALMIETRTFALSHSIRLSNAPIHAIRWSQNGGWLGAGTADGVICLLQPALNFQVSELRGHRGSIHDIDFQSDGKGVVSASADGTVRLWDLPQSLERSSIPLPLWSIQQVTILNDNRSLIASDYRRALTVNTESSVIEQDLTFDHWTFATAVSLDGTLLATAGEKDADGGGGVAIRLWDRRGESGKNEELVGLLDSSSSVEFSPDSKFLAAQCHSSDHEDTAVRIWDVTTRDIIGTLPGGTYWQFSPDCGFIAVVLAGRVTVFDLQRRKTSGILDCETTQVTSLMFSPDSQQLATAGVDGTIRLWNMEKHELVRTLQNDSPTAVHHLMYSPNGPLLLASDERETVAWSVKDAKRVWAISDCTGPMRITPDGRTLITAPGEVHFWQMATGEELLRYPDYGYDSRTLAVSSDGRTIVQAGGNRDETNGVVMWKVRAR